MTRAHHPSTVGVGKESSSISSSSNIQKVKRQYNEQSIAPLQHLQTDTNTHRERRRGGHTYSNVQRQWQRQQHKKYQQQGILDIIVIFLQSSHNQQHAAN